MPTCRPTLVDFSPASVPADPSKRMMESPPPGVEADIPAVNGSGQSRLGTLPCDSRSTTESTSTKPDLRGTRLRSSPWPCHTVLGEVTHTPGAT